MTKLSRKNKKLGVKESRVAASAALPGVVETLEKVKALGESPAVKETVARLERKAQKLEYAAHGLSLAREEQKAARVKTRAVARDRDEKYRDMFSEELDSEVKDSLEAKESDKSIIVPDLVSVGSSEPSEDPVVLTYTPFIPDAAVREGVSWLAAAKRFTIDVPRPEVLPIPEVSTGADSNGILGWLLGLGNSPEGGASPSLASPASSSISAETDEQEQFDVDFPPLPSRR